jgi:SOS-response transcriptional repressor LexA
VLLWVAAFIEEKGFAPSFVEIAAGLGYKSLATVHKHLVELARSGYIKRERYARGIILVRKRMKRGDSCPTCGRGSVLEVNISGAGPDFPTVTDSAGSSYTTVRHEDGTFTATRSR